MMSLPLNLQFARKLVTHGVQNILEVCTTVGTRYFCDESSSELLLLKAALTQSGLSKASLRWIRKSTGIGWYSLNMLEKD